MRDGRRKRLGLVEGGGVDASQPDYLDRILSDEEAALQPNTYNLGEVDANVSAADQRQYSDAYQFLLGGGFPQEEVEAPVVAPDFTGGQMIDTSGGGGTLGPINLNDFEPQNQNPAYEGMGDTTMPSNLTSNMVGNIDTTPVDTYTSPTANVAPDGTTMADMTDDVNMNLIDQPFADTPVVLGSGNNALGLQDPQSLAIGPDGAVDFGTGGLEDEGQAVGEEFADTPVSTPSGNNPFGYEDLNPSLLANPAIANTSGLNDIGADIGVDNLSLIHI